MRLSPRHLSFGQPKQRIKTLGLMLIVLRTRTTNQFSESIQNTRDMYKRSHKTTSSQLEIKSIFGGGGGGQQRRKFGHFFGVFFLVFCLPSEMSRSRISQAKMVGFSRLYCSILETTVGVATLGLEPPMMPDGRAPMTPP